MGWLEGVELRTHLTNASGRRSWQNYFRIADDTARISLLSSEHGACDLIHAIQKPMFKPQYQLVVQVKGVRSADFDWLVQWENDLA